MKKYIATTTCFVMICAVYAGNVFAQGYYDAASSSQLFPYRNPPPLSPWLELERASSSSELGSYHQYVKPRLEMQRMIETQQGILYRQRESQMKIQERVQGLELKQTGRAAPTGQQVRFRDYGNFYPKKSTR